MSLRERPKPLPIVAVLPTVKLPICHTSQGPMHNWCWVACAAMVLTYRQVSFGRMCCLPAFALPRPSASCCNGIGGGECDVAASKELITALYSSFNIPVVRVASISPEDLIAEIDSPNCSPVEIGYVRSGFGFTESLEPGAVAPPAEGHVILVFGRDSSGTNFFVHDPLSQAEASRTYKALLGLPGGGVWKFTWKGLTKPTQEVPNRAC